MPQSAYQIFDVTKSTYHADPNGNMDAGTAFMNALHDAGLFTTAGVPSMVVVPPGTYLFTQSGPAAFLNIPSGVVLQGSYQGPVNHGDGMGHPPTMNGTIFKIMTTGSANNNPFLQMNSNSAVRGISFWWPNQSKDAPTPITYPFAIGAPPSVIPPRPPSVQNILIENIELVNAFQGISLIGMDRHLVRNVIGQAFSIGIEIDQCYDTGRLENVQLGTYWSGFSQDAQGVVSPNIAAYQFANGTAFLVKGTDSQMITNCSARGYNIGVWVQATVSPLTMPVANCLFQGLNVQTCQIAVRLDIGDPEAGIQFTNFNLAAETNGVQTNQNGAAVVVSATFGKDAAGNVQNPPAQVRFTNGEFWGLSPSVRIAGVGSVLLTDCALNDTASGNSIDATNATAGTLMVMSCQFTKGGQWVNVGSNLTKVVLVGNTVPKDATFTYSGTAGSIAPADNL